MGERYVEENASFAALFWSMVLAMLYHCSGLASEGLLDAMVATAFCIWALRPSGTSPLWFLGPYSQSQQSDLGIRLRSHPRTCFFGNSRLTRVN
jgi:hypothetical protein